MEKLLDGYLDLLNEGEEETGNEGE